MTKKSRRHARGDGAEPARVPKSAGARTTMPAIPPLIVAALVAATLLAYAPALSAPFVMDDESAIAESAANPWRAPAGSPVAGRPVTSATLALNHAANTMMGIDQRPDPDGPHKAVGYRLLNVLLHLCTGALLFGTLRRTIRGRAIPEGWRDAADPIAGAACALWLLHPLQTEAINYVVQRTELLASMLSVAALYASIRAWDAPSAAARTRWYVAGAAACAAGMLSKETAIAVPLAVLLYDRAFRLPSWRALARPGNGRGWFYVALVAACVTPYLLVAAGARGSTAGFAASMPWYEYAYSQCWAVAHYVRLVAWPAGLTVDYGEQAVGGARATAGLVVLSALGAATLAAWMRVARWGWLAYLGSMFFILLAPSSSVVPIRTEIAAERRMYLALIVVTVLVVVAAEWVRRRFLRTVPARRVLGGLTGLAVVLAILTAARSSEYASPERLWRGEVREVPGNLRGYVNLGHALERQRPPKLAEAESLFRYAAARDTSCRNGCAELARVLAGRGLFDDAAALLERTLAHDPGNRAVERRLALVLMKGGSFESAVPHLERIAAAFPTEQNSVVLAVAYFAVRRQQDGMTAFQRAMARYPDNAEIKRLGSTLYAVGRDADAVPHLRQLAISLAKGWD